MPILSVSGSAGPPVFPWPPGRWRAADVAAESGWKTSLRHNVTVQCMGQTVLSRYEQVGCCFIVVVYVCVCCL